MQCLGVSTLILLVSQQNVFQWFDKFEQVRLADEPRLPLNQFE